MKLDEKKKPAWFMLSDRCPYTGLPITHPESYACKVPKTSFGAEVAKFGNNILYVKLYGYVTSEAESESLKYLDQYISRHFEKQNGIIYIEDYSGLTGADAGSRKQYISYFKRRAILLACILFNLPPVLKISFELFKKLNIYSSRAHAVSSYEQAMDLALELMHRNFPDLKDADKAAIAPGGTSRGREPRPGSGWIALFDRMMEKLKSGEFFLTQSAKKRLLSTFENQIIDYFAAIDWRTPGLQPCGKIPAKILSSKKLMDAISFVKSEIDTLLEERAASESAIRESEAKYRLLVQHAKVGILEYEFERQRILSVNDEMVRFSGFSREELLAMNSLDLLTGESRKRYLDRMERVLSGQAIPRSEVYQSLSKDHAPLWWVLNSTIVHRDGRPYKANVMITDITEIKESERRLLEYQDKLKRLSIRLSMVEEDQRRDLASHLHENIGQELFVMQLQLAAFEKTIDHPAARQSLQQIKAQLLTVIKETKSLTFDLSPPVLYDFGLKEAVRTLGANLAAKHLIHIKTDFEGDMDAISDDIKTIVYRSVKELMHNTVKHAGARSITLRMTNAQGRLCVDFRDDGAGFADAQTGPVNHEGFGLFDIREKLNHLDGFLTIDSAPGHGTAIRMEVPLGPRPDSSIRPRTD